jgi:hypothetical protein
LHLHSVAAAAAAAAAATAAAAAAHLWIQLTHCLPVPSGPPEAAAVNTSSTNNMV